VDESLAEGAFTLVENSHGVRGQDNAGK
ncbi:MAG: hypothetical protein QOI69_1094, partial [Pseudonocardiales bacterium]|nr:hypothetical protein [Pseudonocardiales bacterium]